MNKLRENIPHFKDMPVSERWKLVDQLRKDGWRWHIPTALKLDGFIGQFGMDLDKKYWFRSARSPLIYKGKSDAFLEFAQKNNRPLDRAKAYKNLADYLIELMEAGTPFRLQPGQSYTAEFFDMEQAVAVGDNMVKFVNVPYRASMFSNYLTIFPFQPVTVLEFPQWRKFLNPGDFAMVNTDCWIRNPFLRCNIWKNLPSHGVSDLEWRSLAEQLLSEELFPGLYNLGPHVEGIVVYFNDKKWKIVSDIYTKLRKQK